jgi:hypothetical protein
MPSAEQPTVPVLAPIARRLRRPRAARASLATFVAVALVVAACSGDEVAPFGTAEVTVEPVAQVISAPADVIDRTYAATVRAAARVDVTAPGVATLTRLDVSDGDEVVAGQTLGVLRSDALLVALRQAEAAVASARVQRSGSQSALDRIEGRVPNEQQVFDSRAEEVDILIANTRADIVDAQNDRGLSGAMRDAVVAGLRMQEQALLAEREERLQAIAQVGATQASVTQAEQALTQARRAVADLTLVAPVDGVVRLASDLAAGGGPSRSRPAISPRLRPGHHVDARGAARRPGVSNMPGHKRAHYRGDYARGAAHVRALAYGDPTTRCWRCGLTLAERRVSNPRATWDAGHLEDGAIGGALAPECSTCNRSAGAAAGYRRGQPRSRKWLNY